MYEVTIEHPAVGERTYVADGPGGLRDIVWGVARAQGRPITDEGGRDREMIHAVGALRSRADFEGAGRLEVGAVTVKVEPADDSAYACQGHQGEDAVLLGGPEFCDGSCVPRRRFKKAALLDLADALEDAELDASGGCSACGLEAGQKCVACGRCNCDRHDDCKRPAGR
jgi:hypothetical protein